MLSPIFRNEHAESLGKRPTWCSQIIHPKLSNSWSSLFLFDLVAFGTFSNLTPQNRNWWLEWFLGKSWLEFPIHVQQSREPPSHLTSCWTLTATGMCTARCTAFARVETQSNATGIGWTSRTTWLKRQTWWNKKHVFWGWSFTEPVTLPKSLT